MLLLRLCLAVSLFVLMISGSIVGQVTPPARTVLFPVEQNKRWGYIDSSGSIAIEPQFEAAGKFADGLAPVEVAGKWGYLNQNGVLIVKPQYSGAHEFSEGMARVQVGGDEYQKYGKWGFIDQSGQMIIQPQFDEMEGVGDEDSDFHEGLAMFEVNYKKGFIDKSGKVVIPPRFYLAYHFTEGLASVTEDFNAKWGYIDKIGNWAIAPKLDWGSLFSDGLAPVAFNGVCGYVDHSGELKLKPEFQDDKDCAVVWGSFDNGLSRWKIGKKYGFINQAGKVVIKPEFDLTFNFSEGLAFVEKDGKYGFINQTGEMVIEPQFYHARDFQNGLAWVSSGARESWGYINRKGEFVWKTGPAVPQAAAADSFVQAGHTRDLGLVGWNSDGSLFASYSPADGWIKVWDPKSSRLIWDIHASNLNPGTDLPSPDGHLLVSAIEKFRFQIREVQSGKIVWDIKRQSTPARITSPDGSLVAESGSYGDACVRLFDAKTNQLIRRLEGHPGIIYAIAFSPDGKFVASGSGDRTIKFWDAQSGKLLNSLLGHTEKITSLAFSADAKTLVSGSADDTLKIWDVSSGSLLRSISAYGGISGVSSVVFSPDGKTVIAGSSTKVRIWETQTGKQLRTLETHEAEVRVVRSSPDGTMIASAHEDGTIKLWGPTSPAPVRIIKGSSEDLHAMAFSQDGKLLAVGYNEGDTRINLWSVQTGQLTKRFAADSDYVRSLAFSPDGRMVVSGHMSDDIKLWDARTGKLLRQLKQPFSETDQVAFSPDSSRVVSGGENQNILLWDANSGKLIWSLIRVDWEAERRAAAEAAERIRAAAVAGTAKQKETDDADKAARNWKNAITVSFEHFGEPINPLAQRLAEKGDPKKSLIQQSAKEATGAWLRLRNSSPLPISFRTDSYYLPRPNCGVKLANGRSPGLCDGMEVSIQYGIQEANGKVVPWGIDVASETILPPGASALFSVPLAHLENGRVIFITYKFLKENSQSQLEDYGTDQRVNFLSSALPRH